MNQQVRILFSGGGTMGSVSPLLAVYQELKKKYPDSQFLFLGTKNGPEQKIVESYQISFKSIESGKFRRYWSWQNIIDPLKIILGFFQALKLVYGFKPQAVMVAGAFVGVPVAWASWLLRIPVLVHQQDIEKGLANKLMSPIAKKITVSFDVSLKDFPAKKTILTGNPIKSEFYNCQRESALVFFHLNSDLPVILITGGGTGSQNINNLVKESLPKITKFAQVIHTTGKGKSFNFDSENYHQYEFLSHEMPEALCVADLVVSRAGLSTLTELSISSKPVVLIPLYGTHQELNASYYQKNNSAVVVSEKGLSAQTFSDLLRDLLSRKDKLESLSDNIAKIMPRDGALKIAGLLIELIS